MHALSDLFRSIRKPHSKEVFFRSLKWNRQLVFWYADKVVNRSSIIRPLEKLQQIDDLRKAGNALTFICNHLTYADSHVIETLLIRSGLGELANHLIHIAGQKTYEVYRRFFTRSLNTVRVYQPKAKVDRMFKRKMNARALKWAAHLKRKGYSLLVYPEGTRTRRHKQFNLIGANPKTTVYFRNSYVVPLALMGAEKLMPVGKWIPRPATVRLHVGEPIQHSLIEQEMRQNDPEKSDLEIRQEAMLYYMKRINQLLDPEYRDHKHQAIDATTWGI